MGITINYNQKDIILYYTSKSLLKVDLDKFRNFEVKGAGEGENYKEVEQEAQLYLIKNAILKKYNHRLK